MALALIPIASIPAHATTLTCGFGENPSGDCVGGTAADKTFDFSLYSVELDFHGLTGSFDISMTDVPTNQSDYVSETQDRFANLPGYQCVAIVDPTVDPNSCREFDVATDPATAAGQTYSSYVITIRWLYDSEPLFPDDGGRIRLLHDSSQNQDNQFADITIPGSYEPFVPVGPFVADPGIGGLDNNFQAFVVAQAPAVPEPATLMLLGTGIGGFVYRRRRTSRT